MGLLILLGGLLAMSVGILLRRYATVIYLIPTFLWIGLVIFTAGLNNWGYPQDYTYPLKARVSIDNSLTTIYFSTFIQEDKQITIDFHAVGAIHWTDFNFVDISKTPLTITLLDNDNKFVYTDRRSGETFNEPVNQSKATQ